MAKKNIYKITEKILSLILNVLLTIVTIIIIIGGYYIYQIKIVKNDYANLFGYAFFEISTGSMADALNIGDGIIVKLTNDVTTGDIIVYKQDNYYITHRVIEKEGEIVTTKGDANNAEDEPIQISQICGRVEKIIPNVEAIKKTFSSPTVLVLIVVTLVAIGFFIFYKQQKKMEEK